MRLVSYGLVILGATCFGQGAMLAGAEPGFDWILVGVVMAVCGLAEAARGQKK